MQGNKSKKKRRKKEKKKEKETHYLLFLSGIKKSKSNNNRSTVPIYSRSFFLSLLISRYCEDTVSFQAPSIDLLLPLIKSNLLLPSSSSNSVCFPPCDSWVNYSMLEDTGVGFQAAGVRGSWNDRLIRTEQEGLKDLTIPYKGNIFSTPTPPFFTHLVHHLHHDQNSRANPQASCDIFMGPSENDYIKRAWLFWRILTFKYPH